MNNNYFIGVIERVSGDVQTTRYFRAFLKQLIDEQID